MSETLSVSLKLNISKHRRTNVWIIFRNFWKTEIWKLILPIMQLIKSIKVFSKLQRSVKSRLESNGNLIEGSSNMKSDLNIFQLKTTFVTRIPLQEYFILYISFFLSFFLSSNFLIILIFLVVLMVACRRVPNRISNFWKN